MGDNDRVTSMSLRTADSLARVAAIYRDAVDQQRSPVDAVAEKLDITTDAAKQRIRRARRAGLLAAHRGVFDNAP